MTNPTPSPIDRTAVRVDSLLDSGAGSAIEQENRKNALIDAQSAEGLVQAFRTAKSNQLNGLSTGLEAQEQGRQAMLQIYSCVRRSEKAAGAESRAWKKLEMELQVEAGARRDVIHYLRSGLVQAEALATRAVDLASAIRAVDDLVTILDEA